MITLKYFLLDATKHKSRVCQLYFIGAFLQAKIKNTSFVKLDSIYADYFPEYSKYFGRALRLLKSMYGMPHSGKLFSGELTEWLLEAVFIKYQCQMSIYYNYAPDGRICFVLSYVNDFVYCYTYEALEKWFVDTLEKRFHVNFLVYAYWLMSIIISQMKDHTISVDQARYATSNVAKYLDTPTAKATTKFYKTTLPSDMILTKADTSTSDEQVERLNRGCNIHYRSSIGSSIYLLSTRVGFIFEVHKVGKFLENLSKVHF